MQTPQVIKPDLLKRGFELVNEKGYEVTDDVSIVEFMGERVQITQGSYVNIKVTTPEDMFTPSAFSTRRRREQQVSFRSLFFITRVVALARHRLPSTANSNRSDSGRDFASQGDTSKSASFCV